MSGEQGIASGTPLPEADADAADTNTEHCAGDGASNNVVDLTEETEAESNTRALRVGLAEYQAQNVIIKQEEVDDSISQDTNSEYTEERNDESTDNNDGTDSTAPRKRKRARTRKPKPLEMPYNLDDAADLMGILFGKRSMLERKRDNKTLKKGDATRLRNLERDVKGVEKRVQELIMAEAAINNAEMRVKTEDTDTESLPATPAA
ncbi:hypothetical protein C8A05DRAFT_33937 [Staphylotrichum tortipilum]|uniref:Uncharacterized protein n=1 Tax=Staphylotrichum tortipilum TaxID=2831512 RepID=A0AAN6RTG4_9PEZI|nr:hypothetical protein C8A05DRAFT_33937 [Staphylotrichum longicolle]